MSEANDSYSSMYRPIRILGRCPLEKKLHLQPPPSNSSRIARGSRELFGYTSTLHIHTQQLSNVFGSFAYRWQNSTRGTLYTNR